ncbi:MAG: hypothetical protein BGO77_01125 [Caedibacter sp. 37-49]|nr:MAG: hypothetical protein BGO77_01125 [Caedibacter sp. 37-49]
MIKDLSMKRGKSKSLKLIEFLKIFLIIYGCFIMLMPVLEWSQDVVSVGGWFETSLSLEVLKTLSISQRLTGWFVETIGSALFGIVLTFLYMLLELIRQGEPFSKNSISLFEKISRFYLFSIIYEPISETVLSFITTLHLPVGQRTLTIGFGTDNINSILLATCLYLIVFLIKQAHQISEEQRAVI